MAAKTKAGDDKIVPITRKKADDNGAEAPLFTIELPIADVDEGNNPRKLTEAARDKDLADSVKQHGILQPIRVRPISADRYEVVAGHRRLAAARAAKMTTIPVVIATPTDQDAFVQSLVENLQREDLNPLDEARAFRQLIDEGGLTQDALGKRINRSQPYISNALRLLTLAEPVQEALADGKLSQSHAKALVTLDPERQEAVAKQAVEKSVSSKDLEWRIQQEKEQQRNEAARKDRVAKETAAFIERIAEAKKAKEVTKKTTIVVRDDLAGADVKQPLVTERDLGWDAVHRWTDSFTCDCDAVKLEWNGGLEKVCIVAAHFEAYETERKKELAKVAAERTRKVGKFRKAVTDNLAASETELNEDGLRVLMYVLYAKDHATATRIIKRAGLVSGENPTWYGPDLNVLWQAVEQSEAKVLLADLLEATARVVVPNVYGPAREISGTVAVRTWLQTRFGLDAEIVRGGRTDEEWEKELRGPYYADEDDEDDDEDDDGEAVEQEPVLVGAGAADTRFGE